MDARVAAGATVYPEDVFRELALTPLADVKAVIVGQDPYHGPGQAHGLAFSVPAGQKTPTCTRGTKRPRSSYTPRSTRAVRS